MAEFEFGIRSAVPEDAEAICSLIQEFADYEQMRDGPKLDPDQLSLDIASGLAHALLAFSSHNELAGQALFYFPISINDGKSLFLEDLYIRARFRRLGIGFRLIHELKKISKLCHCSQITWNVLSSSVDAIAFYARATGAIGEARTQWWVLERSELWRVIADVKQKFCTKPLSYSILLDGEETDQEKANIWTDDFLSAQWHLRDGQLLREREKCLRLFGSASLGAIVAQQSDNGRVLGAALFHRKSFSSWTGRFMIVDRLMVKPEFRRNGIGTAIIAELATIALKAGCSRIGFSPQPKGCEAEPFFKSLNCVNMTAKEGLLTYRWKC